MSKKFVSQTVFFAFIILTASSFILYFLPGAWTQGGWRFIGLSRSQWMDVHLTSGFLFLSFGLWHTIKNWSVLANSFKKLAAAGWRSAMPVLGALALNIFVLVGALAHIPPMEQVLNLFQQIKTEFRQNAQTAQPPARLLVEASVTEPSSKP